MGYEVSVYSNKRKEIDFRAVKENKVYLVQVAYSVAEDKAYEREFSTQFYSFSLNTLSS